MYIGSCICLSVVPNDYVFLCVSDILPPRVRCLHWCFDISLEKSLPVIHPLFIDWLFLPKINLHDSFGVCVCVVFLKIHFQKPSKVKNGEKQSRNLWYLNFDKFTWTISYWRRIRTIFSRTIYGCTVCENIIREWGRCSWKEEEEEKNGVLQWMERRQKNA